MADDKKTKLSIVIRAIDQATSKIKAINDRLDRVTKPFRELKKELGDMREKSGLDDVIGGFKGVGSALADVLTKVAIAGGVIGGAVAGLFKLVDGFDEIGDKAERIGVSVDFLAQMRYAAERSGAAVSELDTGLENFSKSLGQARGGTGRMAAFLNKVSPALLKQLKAAKDNESAFDLLASAMGKLEDPAKRAALAQATLGDAALAPLFAKGPQGIKELRDRYLELAGSQEGAAAEAGKVDDALKDFKAATDGIKAALVEGLGPALTEIVDKLKEWLVGHREDIKKWAVELGKRIPGAVNKVVDAFKWVVGVIKPFVDEGWKLKTLAVVLAATIVGPLLMAVVKFGIALATTPVGWITAGLAAIAAGAYLLIDNWDAVSGFFSDLWSVVKSAFGMFFDWVSDVFLNYTPMGLIIQHWGPIKGFFVDLWDSVTSVFEDAWGIIEKIVGKITWAVDKVTGAVETVGDFLFGGPDLGDMMTQMTGTPVNDVVGQTMRSLDAIRAQATQAKVTVDFANAPKGTRVSADPQSTASIDFTVGYQMNPGGL